MKIEEAIKRASDVSMTREEVIQQLSWWKELWEIKKAECDKYENREYAWEKTYMLNCNIEVCKIAIEALKQIRAIDGIIDVSNITIQEDVLKYKMIVDVVKGEW